MNNLMKMLKVKLGLILDKYFSYEIILNLNID